MKYKKTKLKDIIEEIIDYRGKTPKKMGENWSNSGYRALSAKNIKTGKIVQPETIRYVDEKLYRKWMKQEVEKGTILITSEAPFGEIYYWNSEEKIVLSQRLFGLKINKGHDSKYIYYFMTSNYFQNELQSRATGTTVFGLRQPALLDCNVLLPDLEEQKKIAKMLSYIDEKITLNNQINDNLQELINKTFIEYFVNYNIDNVKLEFVESDIGLIPKGWSIGILSDIVEFSNGYGFDSKKMLDKNGNETFSVFKMGNINIGGGINKSKTKSWMKKEDCEGLDKFIAKKGDILMCMTDMKNSGNPLLGHTALIDKDNEFVINQRVGILRCTKGISYEYVYTLSNLDFFISDLRSRANSGVQVNLTTTGICNTQILIPDKDCIDKFNKIAKPLYEKKFNIMQQNETLEQLRDTLLPKLMNGEIDLDNIEI